MIRFIYEKKALITALFVFPLFLSCATLQNRPRKSLSELTKVDAMDTILSEVKTLYNAKKYQKAADILKNLGEREHSYYRMDEVLYWLGRCRIEQGEFEKAKRAFNLLRKYYPRAESKFEDLTALESKVHKKLAQIGVQSNKEKESSNQISYKGPLVSNAYYETDIRQALTDLSAKTGIPIVADATVQGYVTVEFKNVPLEKALTLLLAPLGLSFRKVNNYYLVGSPTPDNPSFRLLAITKKIKPKYVSVREIPKLVPEFYKKFLQIDENSNTVTITAPPDIISGFEGLLEEIDRPPRQVMIEAMVVEMSKEARKSLGLDWDWTGTKGNSSYQISKFSPTHIDSSLFAELIRKGVEYKGILYDLRMALRALALKDKARIRANPRIVTQDGKEATIRIGEESYYSLLSGSAAYPYFTLEKIATGITLKITPYIGNTSEITTKISIEVSDVTGVAISNLPVTTVRSVNTEVQVSNGQTIGIGGLISKSARERFHGIPLLGDIPFLGHLFGQNTWDKDETEVVILITPHLLINPQEFEDL